MIKRRGILLVIAALFIAGSAWSRVFDEQDKSVLEDIYGKSPMFDVSSIGGTIGVQGYYQYETKQFVNPFLELEGRWVGDWFGVYARLEAEKLFMGEANNYYLANTVPPTRNIQLTYLYFYFKELDKILENVTVGNLWLDYSPYSISGIYGLQGGQASGSVPAAFDYDVFVSQFESGGVSAGGKLVIDFPFLNEINLTPALSGYFIRYNASNTNLIERVNAFTEGVISVALRFEPAPFYAEAMAGFYEEFRRYSDADYDGVIESADDHYTNAYALGFSTGWDGDVFTGALTFRWVRPAYMPRLRYEYLDYATLRRFTNEMSVKLEGGISNIGAFRMGWQAEWVRRETDGYIVGLQFGLDTVVGTFRVKGMMNDVYYEQYDFFRGRRWWVAGCEYETEIGIHTIFAGLKLELSGADVLFSQMLKYEIYYQDALTVNFELKHRTPSIVTDDFSIGTPENFVDNYVKLETELRF